MKIEKRTNKEYLFGQLNSGDVFVYQNMICIKTGYLEAWGTEAAVDLENGGIIELSNEIKVEKAPDALLTWEI